MFHIETAAEELINLPDSCPLAESGLVGVVSPGHTWRAHHAATGNTSIKTMIATNTSLERSIAVTPDQARNIGRPCDGFMFQNSSEKGGKLELNTSILVLYDLSWQRRRASIYLN